MKLQRNKSIFELLVVVSLILAFFVFASLFVFYRSNIFPILNALIYLSFLFLFRGKYRIYALIFFSSYNKLMTLINSSIGSFMSWNMLIYLIVILIQRLLSKKQFSNFENKVFISYVFLALYSFLIDLINIADISFFKLFSTLSYLSIPLLVTLDIKGEKNLEKMIVVLAATVIASNVFCLIFIYILKEHQLLFLDAYIPSYISYFEHVGISGFRFPGLIGDPNHNALLILFSSSLNIFYLFKNKKHYVLHISLIVILQIFAVLGQSKTYIFALLFLIVLYAIFLFKKAKYFLVGTIISLMATIVLLFVVLSINQLAQPLLRILNTDTRAGFLESFTTQRFHIWMNYLSSFNGNPFKSIIGHGILPNRLFGWDYHNSIVQLLWEYGLIGIIIFGNYVRHFIVLKNDKNIIIKIIPIIVVLLFSLSLHIIYDELLYAGLYMYYSLNKDCDFKKEEINTNVSKLEILQL